MLIKKADERFTGRKSKLLTNYFLCLNTISMIHLNCALKQTTLLRVCRSRVVVEVDEFLS